MKQAELDEVVQLHTKWVRGEEGGRRAYLQGADLRGAYLQGADLRGAYLQGANLLGAYLQGADLLGADLQGADLQGADLQGAYLQGADLQGAYLRGAYLQGAYLQGADLQGADLQGAHLQEAYLQGACLNWQSHNLISEILRQSAGSDVRKRKVAGLILVSRDWCWKDFLAFEDPDREWALDVLREYVREGDDAPVELRKSST